MEEMNRQQRIGQKGNVVKIQRYKKRSRKK